MSKWVAGWMMVSTMAMAGEMVTVPDDYSLLELPEGSLVQMVKEVQLRAGTTQENLVLVTENGFKSKRVLRCDLNYEKSNQRRVIPAGTKLVLGVTSVAPITQDPAPYACFKENQYPTLPSQEHFVSLKSASGIDLMVTCRDHLTWEAPGDLACDYSDVVTVGSLKSGLTFTADKEKLTGVIGLE